MAQQEKEQEELRLATVNILEKLLKLKKKREREGKREREVHSAFLIINCVSTSS